MLNIKFTAITLMFLSMVAKLQAQPVYNTTNGHFYEVVNDYVTWEQADALAKSASFTYHGVTYYGHLGTFTSQEETDWMINNGPYCIGAFLGLKQSPGAAEPDGGWYWVTGEPLNYLNWLRPDEPNNYGPGESYGQMYAGGKWNDAIDGPYGFIVEYEPITIASIKTLLNEVLGGQSLTGTVSLLVAAPKDVTISLLDDSKDISEPHTMVIPKGAMSASFPITTKSVNDYSYALLAARVGVSTASKSLTILPAELAGLTISPSTIYGGNGQKVTGTIFLNGQNGPAKAEIILTSEPDGVQVDSPAYVPPRAKSVTFPIKHSLTPIAYQTKINATFRGVSKTEVFSVKPILISKFTLTPTVVYGGATVTGTVELNQTAPIGGWAIDLTTNSTDDATLSHPHVVVPAGGKSASFSIETSSKTTTDQTVTVNAMFNGQIKSKPFRLQAVHLVSLQSSSTTLHPGDTANLTVNLNAVTPVEANVTLTSSNRAITITGSGVIPPGQSVGTFTIRAGAVTSSKSVRVKATYLGLTKYIDIKVNP